MRITKIKIDGTEYDVDEINTYSSLPMFENGGLEFYLALNSEDAGKLAREYWEDMAQRDSEEFACMVGTDTLVAWGLGLSAGPGSTAVSSLEEWLDLWLDTPEEHFASYDSMERDVEAIGFELEDDDLSGAGESDAETTDEDDDEPVIRWLTIKELEDDAGSDEYGLVESEIGFIPTAAYRHN